MKNTAKLVVKLLYFVSPAWCCVIGVMMACAGCGKNPVVRAKETPPGRLAETWNFWESFNKAAVVNIGIEALAGLQSVSRMETKDMCDVLEDVIASEKTKIDAITGLPVLHVDPDLTKYAVEFTRARTEMTMALQDFVLLAKEQEEITSASVLGAGLFLNFLEHKGGKEEGFPWRPFLEQTKETAANLQSLKGPAQAIGTKVSSARAALSRLAAEELALRVKLSQNFGREFQPRVTYVAASTSPKRALSEQEIIQSLIGKNTGEVFNPWTFDAPKEFVSLKVASVTNRTETVSEYIVHAHVKGVHSGNKRDLRLALTYADLATRTKLVQVRLLP